MKKLLLMLMICIICIGAVPINTYSAEESSTVWQIRVKKFTGYKIKTKTKKITKTEKKYLGKFYITHYCPCEQCCGAGGGQITASGTVPTAGRTVGVNPSLIPYGTKLKIGKTKGYVAEDTGGGIGWKHIDMFCNSHQEALNAGVGWEKVWSYKTVTKKKKYKVLVPRYEEVWIEVTEDEYRDYCNGTKPFIYIRNGEIYRGM